MSVSTDYQPLAVEKDEQLNEIIMKPAWGLINYT